MRRHSEESASSSYKQDRDAIKALYDAWLCSFFKSDLDGHLNCYTDDALWMNPSSWTDFTKEDSRPFYQEWLDEETLDIGKWEITLDEIVIVGDWAYVRLTTKGSGTEKKTGIDVKHGSRHMSILKRQSNGSWKIVRDIFNNPPL